MGGPRARQSPSKLQDRSGTQLARSPKSLTRPVRTAEIAEKAARICTARTCEFSKHLLRTLHSRFAASAETRVL